jgi:hypothetical protein
MTDTDLHKERERWVGALPIYLGIQAAILLTTFLDFPVYMDAYQANRYLTVGGWVGLWFVLAFFGLSGGVILLIGRTWKTVLSEKERAKLVSGYFLGAIAGLLTLGLRFMPVMSATYFYVIGGLVVLLGAVYLIWTRRQTKLEEIFP